MTNGIGPPSVGPARSSSGVSGKTPGVARAAEPSFDTHLSEALDSPRELRFSKHAEARLRSRGIALSAGDLQKLGEAVNSAEARGARDSLVLSGSLAYVVNVPSRTVVTALYGEQSRGQVFTNIDSAVVI